MPRERVGAIGFERLEARIERWYLGAAARSPRESSRLGVEICIAGSWSQQLANVRTVSAIQWLFRWQRSFSQGPDRQPLAFAPLFQGLLGGEIGSHTE